MSFPKAAGGEKSPFDGLARQAPGVREADRAHHRPLAVATTAKLVKVDRRCSGCREAEVLLSDEGSVLGKERLTDLRRQFPGSERFLEKIDTVREQSMGREGVGGVAGHVEAFHRRKSCNKLFGEFLAVHSRHDDVGEQYIDPGGRGRGHLYGLFR